MMLFIVYAVNTQTDEAGIHFYREWPGRSPSVNASWFIAKAYLANLYYTQRHYKAALETCNEILAIKHSEGNERFAE